MGAQPVDGAQAEVTGAALADEAPEDRQRADRAELLDRADPVGERGVPLVRISRR